MMTFAKRLYKIGQIGIKLLHDRHIKWTIFAKNRQKHVSNM